MDSVQDWLLLGGTVAFFVVAGVFAIRRARRHDREKTIALTTGAREFVTRSEAARLGKKP